MSTKPSHSMGHSRRERAARILSLSVAAVTLALFGVKFLVLGLCLTLIKGMLRDHFQRCSAEDLRIFCPEETGVAYHMDGNKTVT